MNESAIKKHKEEANSLNIRIKEIVSENETLKAQAISFKGEGGPPEILADYSDVN